MTIQTETELPVDFKFTKDFKEAFKLLNDTEKNIFITGNAGTGKSTLLEYFRKETNKNYAIVAAQGITALKAKGETIHSFFKFPLHFVTKDDVKLLKDREVMTKLDTLIIEEASMVSADIFDAIDTSLKKNRKNKYPFGGVQIILFGDLMQIEPVITKNEKKLYEKFYPNGAFFFNANCYEESDFKKFELKEIFRQKDKKFVQLLNKVRDGSINESELSILNKNKIDYETLPEGVIILAPKNNKVEDINLSNLYKLKTPTFTYNAIIKGSFDEKKCPVDKDLKLKVGAQVMIAKNDTEDPRRWVNGSIGIIKELYEDRVKVLVKDKILSIGKAKWDEYKHRFGDNKIEQYIVGSFIQFPFKLAWAVTIHKSQGQTFDKVAIDMDRGAFAHGQTYVALSRGKNLKNTYLLSKINKKDIIADENVINFINDNKIENNPRIETKNEEQNISSGWTSTLEKKLLMLYKKNVPEHALAKIFKVSVIEIRSKILNLIK